MKECPYCVEHIKDETFGFRYYGSDSTNWKKMGYCLSEDASGAPIDD